MLKQYGVDGNDLPLLHNFYETFIDYVLFKCHNM